MLKNRTELFLTIRIVAFLVPLPMMIRRLGMRELVERVTPAKVRREEPSLTPARIMYLCERIMRLLQRTGYQYSCLRRSIVMYHFLRSFGTPVSINFGAIWRGENLMGHSWLAFDEKILFDRRENVARFVHFFSLPANEQGLGSGDGKEKEYLSKMSFD